MTAPAAIKQSDIRRMADIATEKGVIVEMEKDGTIIRVMPNIPEIHNAPAVDPEPSPASNGLAAWRARHESKPRGNPSR